MTIKRTDLRFKFVIFLLCILLLMAGVMPALSSLKLVNAADVTVYFDTSSTGKDGSSHGWKKDMSAVYYYAYSSSGNTGGLKSMTDTGKSGKNGGKLFSASIDSKYTYIIFSSKSEWKHDGDDYKWQTKSLGISGNTAANNKAFIMNDYGYNDNESGSTRYKQGLYTYTLPEEKSFKTQKFSILNMTDTNTTLYCRFTDEKKPGGVWAGLGTVTYSTNKTPIAVNGRYFDYEAVTVPDDNEKGPYSTVEIYDSESATEPINRYYFEEGKILGKTYEYGVSELAGGKKISYRTDNIQTAAALSGATLYLDKTSFGTSGTYSVGGVGTSAIAKDGNASFQTNSGVTVGAITSWTADASLSDKIITVTDGNGNKYNMFGPENAGDDLIVINDNVAIISGKYSVQSTHNELDGQEYITVRADMYDYQYDKFNYNVTYDYWEDDKHKTSNVPDQTSRQGASKRPYLMINEAISSYTDYSQGVGNSPLYLGQFWLPTMPKSEYGGKFDTSTEMYSTTTAGYQRAAYNKYRKEKSGDKSNDQYYIPPDQQLDGHVRSYYEFFGFGNILNNFKWSANLAYRTESQDSGTFMPYDAVVQGLVNKNLNSDKKITAVNGTPLPYFDMDFWNRTYTPSQGGTNISLNDYIDKYENLDFPFFKIPASDITFQNGYTKDNMLTNGLDTNVPYRGDYYVFDSKKYSVRAEKSGGTTSLSKSNKMYKSGDASDMVYDNYGNGDSGSTEIGFFPFNKHEDGGNKEYLSTSKLHYGFGVKYEIDFYLNENGTLDGTVDGIPITFTFQGDDDVWVFLDDELILDMGGAHKNAIGEVNFAKGGSTFISAIGNVSNTSIVSSNTTNALLNDSVISRSKDKTLKPFSDEIKSKATVGKHKITMYYLERGMLNSNLYVMFNLPMSLTRLDVQEDTDFGGINEGFVNAAKYVADQDVFNYKIENKGTDNVVGSEYKAPTTTTVTRSNNESGSIRTTALSPGTGSEHTNNYKGSPGVTYEPMVSNSGGVTYMLSDPFPNTNSVIKDTRSVGSDNGVISLQYGQMATFSKQLNYGSAMQVTQLDALLKPTGADSYGSTDRTASKYYVTYMRSAANDADHTRRQYAGIYDYDDISTIPLGHVEEMYDSVTNYSANNVVNLQIDGNKSNYNFNDPTNGANEYVHLRQVIVNEVKTVDLIIRKDFVTTETYTDPFTFKIHFSNVFGKGDGDGLINYEGIKYTKDSDTTPYALDSNGSFELAANHYITIKGIPVGTKFYVEETSTSAIYDLDRSKSFNLGESESQIDLDSDTEVLARNSRKQGRFTLTKEVYEPDGTTLGNDDETVFTAVVALTAADSVDLAEYDIKANGESITFLDGTTNFEVQISAKTPVTITGLPYGTTYTVTEKTPLPKGYDKKLISETNVVYADSVSDGVAQKIDNENGESATISNVKKTPTGSLTVQKLTFNTETNAIMTGVQQEFPITITFTGLTSDISSSLTYKYDGSDLDAAKYSAAYSSGTLTITANINPGDSVDDSKALVIDGIPVGTAYKVTENDAMPQAFKAATKGYTGSAFYSTNYKTTSGTYEYVLLKDTAKAIGGNNDYVVVENEFTPIVMPETGGTPLIFLFPYGIIAIALSGTALVIYKKKLQGEVPLKKRKGRSE